MALTVTREDAYRKGFEASKRGGWASDSLVDDVEGYFPHWRQEFPLSAHLDYRQEIVNLWQARVDADLDLTKYPECRGLRDIVLAEQQGYLDGCGGNKVQTAYFFNYSYFLRLRLATRWFGFPDKLKGVLYPYVAMPAECSSAYFADTPDGPVCGKNLDTSPSERFGPFNPYHTPGGVPTPGVRLVGSATSAVLCDDEPADIFPVNLDYIMPADIRTVRDWIPFRHRYCQFCGPGNTVWVDHTGDAVAVEHTNTMMGWRYAENGVAAVTALAYQTPALKQHKAQRDELSLQKRGWTHDSPDYAYWQGCSKRYDRLMMLVQKEVKRGLTVEGMARLLLDPDGPLPERISTANEPFHPVCKTDFWTMATWVTIMYGPKRRTYRWSHTTQPDGPIFHKIPELFLDQGVEMRPEFEEQRQRLARIGKN